MTTTARDIALIFTLEMLSVDPSLSSDQRRRAAIAIDAIEAEIAAERAAEQEPARG